MSKRRVQFEDSADDDLEKAYEDAKAEGSGGVTTTKARFGFKDKHSLDSDEEDNLEQYDLMRETDIEGQEETGVDIQDGITFTPFNMKEELEEGHFDSEGMYIFKKEQKVIRDNWMDNIDWVKVKSQEKNTGEEAEVDESRDADDSRNSEEPEYLDEVSLYKEMIELMKPGESVLKALRRLGGGKAGCSLSSASQRWKAKRQKQTDTSKDSPPANKEHLLKLTGLADRLLSQGNLEIYQDTYEKLCFKIKVAEDKDKAVEPQLPGHSDNTDVDMSSGDNKQTQVTATDSLDMFADEVTNKSSENTLSANNSTKPSRDQTREANGSREKGSPGTAEESNEVCWEYKWEKGDDQEIHGPYTSKQMLEWTEEGFFDEGVLVRKVGATGQFYSSRRIDFDLYT